MIAALYVLTNGPYFGLEDVEPWDICKDARTYDDDYPVVAHPPCERWGRYWSGGPKLAGTAKAKKKGDDAGCFKAALEAVRRCGGVLEHPEASHAWSAFGLTKPPRSGGWVRADNHGGFTCCVAQGHYGHRAQKLTWLYVCGIFKEDLPELRWGLAPGCARLDDGFHTTEERRRLIRTGVCQRLSKRQRLETPTEFRDLLLSIARLARNGFGS